MIKPVTQEARDLADRVIAALQTDELVEGYDLEAGMFGTALSQLLIELAAEMKEAGRLRADNRDLQEQVSRLREKLFDADVRISEANWDKDRTQWGA